jgi:hypothetical protein
LAIEPLDAETPPDWLDEVKFSRLLQLEVEERKIATEISDLVVYPRLLYAQGEILEAAVAASLRRIGLHDVEPQRRGSPIDIRASTPSGAKLGFEVTGSISCIRKGDRKVGQLLAFDFSEGDETKPILVANTQRNLRIADREGPFSDWVRDYFASHHRVLLMTGWDLYRLVRDVFESRRTSAQAIQVLDATTGILDLK